ncbi:MAG: PorV/PorQ family protein [Bacteroidales bacterium]
MNLRGIILLWVLCISANLFSQNSEDISLPILNTNSNARIGSMADIGVVSSIFYKDVGLFQNPSLISGNSEFSGTNLFLRNIKDNNLTNSYISGWSGYHAIDTSHAFGFNFSYLNYEDSFLNSESVDSIKVFEPYELFFQLTYKYRFNKTISGGLGLKYIQSNYGFGLMENFINTFSIDLGFNYSKMYLLSDYSNLHTSAGLAITNFGPRISNADTLKSFIPTKLLLGLLINPDIHLSELFRLNFELMYQAEKYLTPSQPVYNTEGILIDGMNPDISCFTALYQSFYDSPDGFTGEIDEIRNKFGSELRLNYSNTAFLAFRHGRIFELESLGGGNYQAYGCGLGLFGFMVDYLYIKSDNKLLNKDWAIMISASHNLNGNFFRF